MSNPQKVELTVVVNGKAETVPANLNAPLHTVIQHALQQSGNSGQPTDNWELRDGAGQVLDPARKVEDYGIASGTTLFLNLKAGVGGCR